ncbi:MAG: helix-turn-helix domain-containing protein, partial [Panacagrimonas sp.]
LNVFPIKVPPLRERRADIPILMDHFLAKFSQRHRREITGFTARAIDAVLTYDFPGNIRELENMIERGVIMAPLRGAIDVADLFTEQDPTPVSYGVRCDGRLGDPDSIDPADAACHAKVVSSQIQDLLAGASCEALGTSLRDIEKNLEGALVDRAIAQAGGNISAAARLLGLTRSGLIYRMSRRKQEELADSTVSGS